MRVLPNRCRRYLTDRKLRFEEHGESDQKAIIIRGFVLPAGRFDASLADVLLLLPNCYPDGPPDMFYTLPWLRLAGSASYPFRADQPLEFQGHRWQRWSRHNNEWRPGVDGIWTMIKRIETALECTT